MLVMAKLLLRLLPPIDVSTTKEAVAIEGEADTTAGTDGSAEEGENLPTEHSRTRRLLCRLLVQQDTVYTLWYRQKLCC